jgi:hypothetical protein
MIAIQNTGKIYLVAASSVEAASMSEKGKWQCMSMRAEAM